MEFANIFCSYILNGGVSLKRITAEEAMRLIPEGSTIGITGFIGSAFPEYMAVKIEESFCRMDIQKILL